MNELAIVYFKPSVNLNFVTCFLSRYNCHLNVRILYSRC